MSISTVRSRDCGGQWFAIYTRSRAEKKLHSYLRKAGYEAFLPLKKERRRWSDRIKTVEVPLLPGYVFINTALEKTYGVASFSGFVRFVNSDGIPAIIRESEIELLKCIVNNDIPASCYISCQKGDYVKIVGGPLLGWEGTVVRKNGQTKVIIQCEGIRQMLCVEVKSSDLQVLKKAEKIRRSKNYLVL